MKPANVKTTDRRWVQWLFIIIFLLIIPLKVLLSQDINIDNYIGLNYVTNYESPPHQNWCIVQDKRGIIYLGNQAALLDFDGVTWRIIEMPNHAVRALAVDDNGTIYIGGVNEIGFFELGPRGGLQYKSLVDQLPDNQKIFFIVFRVNVTKEGIYFRTKNYLFRWDAKSRQMKTWLPEKEKTFDASFTCNGKLFVHQRQVGLMQMVNDSLEMIPGNETFADVRIYVMVPYNDQKLLIGTREKGLYLYEGTNAVPFPTDVSDYLKKMQLYHGIQLSSGDFALATQQGGVVIIDSQGNVKKIFNKASGLQDDGVNYVFEDFQGNLWLALDKGISKIEYGSPVSIYDDNRSNIPGIVLSVVRHGPNNNLYVGTTRGLFYLSPPSAVKFYRVQGINLACHYLLSVDDSLLAATEGGVFQAGNNSEKRKVIEESSLFLHRSQTNPNRIWVGTTTGLVSIVSRDDGQWTKESKFEEIAAKIRNIVEDRVGDLWLGLDVENVIKVSFPVEGKIHPHARTTYDTSYKLPDGEVCVCSAAGHIMFGTKKGLYCFDEKNKVFFPVKTLGDEFAGGSRSVWRLVEDKNKNIWFHSNKRNFQTTIQPDGTKKTILLKIPPVVLKTIYPDPDGKTIWFGCDSGLICYDTTARQDLRDFSTIVREVIVNGTPLIYDSKKGIYKAGSNIKNPFPTFPYKDRNLRFEFVALFFEAESAMQYQCFLEGYDEDWSAWSLDKKRDYTNLDSGLYQFRVRAKNIYENVGKEAVFKFKILPPWYKTWWAFSIYAIAVILMVFLIVKWRSWRLEQEKQRLEQVVKNRTKEINHKNRQLEEQSEKLKEMDMVKSRFFANISHEFRTPLTLIMGPLEQILSDCRDREMERKMKLMLRNSQRLLNLINQLLDLSKFDSGRMKLQAVRQNIVLFLNSMIDSFELAARQHEVDLIFQPESEDITLYFDTEKLENVMCNLLINAIKFTPPGGKVTVSVTASSPEVVEISVRDTGIGIPREQLEYIFDRFFQAEEPSRAHHLKGTGIGLALTKELINLHHGRIDVHSRMGEPSGTEFIIQLPMGKEHLKPEEIIEIAESETPAACKIPTSMLIEEEKNEIETKEAKDAIKPGEDGAHEKDIILVVEDSADVREYIRGSLEPNYTVAEAKDGEEGINKAKEIIPDLIISDVMMPGIDGFELCRVLKKDVLTSHIPVILLTAKAADEDVLEGLETGADDYITKPFNTKILCARIKNLIDLRRQLQQNLKREMTLQPVKTSVSEVDKEFFKDMHHVIEKNLSESDFNVEQMGKKLYMSRATLYRKIMALTGETPTEYIRTYRLKRGAELLKSNYGTVLEVALEVGFSSSAYFTKCFKDKFHQLPSELQASEGK
jgi:signal transduction histidine kinase/DNA-binding response OmpR family regulator